MTTKERLSVGQAIIGTIIILLVFFGIPTICSYLESHYSRQGEVIEIDEKNNLAMIKDTTNNLWQVEDVALNEGDEVTMKMYTNRTDNNIEDDTILKVIVND